MIGKLCNSMCVSQKVSIERVTLESWYAGLPGLMFTAFLGLAQATGRARAQGSQPMRWQVRKKNKTKTSSVMPVQRVILNIL